MKKMMNGLVMVNFLQGEKRILITENEMSEIYAEWNFEWTSLYDWKLKCSNITISSDEIESVEGKKGILILSNYEKNVNIEIEKL